MVWYFTCVYIINRILHTRLWIWILSSRVQLDISLVRCTHSWRVIRYWVKSGSFNGMASPTNIRDFFMFKVKFIRANSENFFKCELPVFVCRRTLVAFLRIYKDTGNYFSLTDRTNALHYLSRSFCVYFQIKLKKRLIPLIDRFREELRHRSCESFSGELNHPSSEDFRMLSL